MKPFPGLSSELRHELQNKTRAWQGDIDPDRDLWECLKEHPSLRVEEDRLEIDTKPIWLHVGFLRIPLGRYTITLFPLPYYMGIQVHCHRKILWWTQPHVHSNGYLCLGEGQIPYRKAVREGRYGDAFTIVLNILPYYNPSSPVKKGLSWMVPRRQCRFCGEQISFWKKICRQCRQELQ